MNLRAGPKEVETEDYKGPDRRSHDWHLDKKVPVVIIMTLLLQVSSSIWWAATAERRIHNLEAQLIERTSDRWTRTNEMESQRLFDVKLQATAARISGLEQLVASSVQRIELQMNRVADKLDSVREQLYVKPD